MMPLTLADAGEENTDDTAAEETTVEETAAEESQEAQTQAAGDSSDAAVSIQ